MSIWMVLSLQCIKRRRKREDLKKRKIQLISNGGA
jgi:hypothetical protein